MLNSTSMIDSREKRAKSPARVSDFKKVLQSELLRRCEKNPRYSLRSFAKSLGIHHATLSGILSGKRKLSTTSIRKLGTAIGLSPTEIKPLLESHGHAPSSTELYQVLSIDTFNAISEWYYDAILELTWTKGFSPDAKWIGRRLGITPSQVTIAIETLQRLKLLEIDSKGRFLDLSRNNTTNLTNDFTSSALQKYQIKVQELSLLALQELPRTERDHTSITMAVQTSDLAAVKEKIKKFRLEMNDFLQRAGATPDAVFQLAVAYFPVTQTDQDPQT